jgi:hypothetical protein
MSADVADRFVWQLCHFAYVRRFVRDIARVADTEILVIVDVCFESWNSSIQILTYKLPDERKGNADDNSDDNDTETIFDAQYIPVQPSHQ